MSYISKEELRKAPYNISEEDLDEAAIVVMQGITKTLIDEYCRQSFGKEGDPTPVEKRLSGSGKLTIFLPWRLISLTSIKVYSTDSSFTTYDPSNFVIKPRYIEWKSMSTSSHRVSVDSFPEGAGNIGVVGLWGYVAPPDAIKYAQGRMIMNLVRDGSINKQKKSENVGDYSYSMAEVENAMTYDPEIDTILKTYKDFRIELPA